MKIKFLLILFILLSTTDVYSNNKDLKHICMEKEVNTCEYKGGTNATLYMTTMNKVVDISSLKEKIFSKGKFFISIILIIICTIIGLIVLYNHITMFIQSISKSNYFLNCRFWNTPYYTLSGVMVPESRVIRCTPLAFTIMSDGCEHACWQCNIKDEKTGIFSAPNKPVASLFNSLINDILKLNNEKELREKWIKYLTSGNKSFEHEQDDKTMILFAYNPSTIKIMKVITNKYGWLSLEDTAMASGGEGEIHKIISNNNGFDSKKFCVKIYFKNKRTSSLEEKIKYMVNNPPKSLRTKNDMVMVG